MKKISFILISFILSNLIISKKLYADSSLYLGANAYVPLIKSLNAKVKRIQDNQEIPSLNWDDQFISSNWQLASSYIELDISCNAVAWKVIIYTNNTQASPLLIQRGGLMCASTNTIHIPLAWVVSDSTVSITNIGEPGELTKNQITWMEGTENVGWQYIKDKGDRDDPNTTAWNESWDNAYLSGYTTILFGGPGSIHLSCLKQAKSPVIIYIEGDFFAATEGNVEYASPIWFDLISY